MKDFDTWRVTSVSRAGRAPGVERSASVSPGQVLQTGQGEYLELRSSENQIMRLGPNSQVTLEETVVGVRPVYRGEVFVMGSRGDDGKYPTSCYKFFLMGGVNAVFARPGREKNTDEFIGFFGETLIYDFDEQNQRYTICVVPENRKAILTVRPEELGRNRYDSRIVDVPDDEYEYILTNYVGNKNWRVG